MSDLILTDTCEMRVSGNSAVVIGFRSGTDIFLPEKVRYEGEDVLVTSIGKEAFSWTSIRSLSIPGSITLLDESSFMHCHELTEVIFLPGSSSFKVCKHAFWGCSCLKSITLPSLTTCLGAFCFFACSSLKSFILPRHLPVSD
jgi:hypothetical protein